MHTISRPRAFAAILALLLLAASPCFALRGIDVVTKDRAKALGLEIRTSPSGPDAVHIELEFAIAGELEKLSGVELNIDGADGKTLASSRLHEERPKPDRVRVSFTAARASLDKMTLSIIAGYPVHAADHRVKVKDFVDLEKLR